MLTPVMAKKKAIRNMTWTPNLEDRRLMEELKAQIGLRADSELMRMGLRALAEKQGRATNG
jgi:hypothetical protein